MNTTKGSHFASGDYLHDINYMYGDVMPGPSRVNPSECLFELACFTNQAD